MQHLDVNGKPPVLDKQGRLREPFDLRLAHWGEGVVERWMPDLVLPLTPKALELSLKPRSKKERDRDERESDDEPTPGTKQELTRTGRRKRRKDEDLTPEQKAKRDKRRARREARKKRRLAGSGGK